MRCISRCANSNWRALPSTGLSWATTSSRSAPLSSLSLSSFTSGECFRFLFFKIYVVYFCFCLSLRLNPFLDYLSFESSFWNLCSKKSVVHFDIINSSTESYCLVQPWAFLLTSLKAIFQSTNFFWLKKTFKHFKTQHERLQDEGWPCRDFRIRYSV